MRYHMIVTMVRRKYKMCLLIYSVIKNEKHRQLEYRNMRMQKIESSNIGCEKIMCAGNEQTKTMLTLRFFRVQLLDHIQACSVNETCKTQEWKFRINVLKAKHLQIEYGFCNEFHKTFLNRYINCYVRTIGLGLLSLYMWPEVWKKIFKKNPYFLLMRFKKYFLIV